MRSRTKILDATLDLIRIDGFEAVTIAAVAQAAGVTRQTVYSNFGTREDLVSQAMAGLAARTLDGIRSRLARTRTVTEYLVELVVAGRSAVRADPVLHALSRAGAGNPIHDEDVITRAKPVARELLSGLLTLDPAIGPELDDIAQMVIRVGLSVITYDDTAIHSDEDLRKFLSRWLAGGVRART